MAKMMVFKGFLEGTEGRGSDATGGEEFGGRYFKMG